MCEGAGIWKPPCSGGTDNLQPVMLHSLLKSNLPYCAWNSFYSFLVTAFRVVGSWCPFYLCHFPKSRRKCWFISCHHVGRVQGEVGRGMRAGLGQTARCLWPWGVMLGLINTTSCASLGLHLLLGAGQFWFCCCLEFFSMFSWIRKYWNDLKSSLLFPLEWTFPFPVVRTTGGSKGTGFLVRCL